MPLNVDIVHPRELSARDIELWAEYQAATPGQAGPYFSSGWTRLVGQMRSDVRVGVFYDSNHTLGFLGFQGMGRRALMPVGGVLSDYQGVVARPGVQIDLHLLVRAARAGRIDLNHALGAPASPGWRQRGEHASWTVDLSAPFEDYAAHRRAAGSKIVRRMTRRRNALERRFGEVRVERASTSEADFDQLLSWKRAQYRETGAVDVLAKPWIDQVVRGAFRSSDPNFGGALYTLYAGDRLLAANFCLRSTSVLHAWFIAHDPEARAASPGACLMDAIVREEAGGRYRELDLGYGDYRYKQELATGRRDLTAGFVGGWSLSSQVRRLEYVACDLAAVLPVKALADAPTRALRRLDVWRGLAEPRR